MCVMRSSMDPRSSERPTMARPGRQGASGTARRTDLNELFAIADALNGSPLNDDEWREIVPEMVDRVVIGGRKKIEVHLKPTWRAPLQLGKGNPRNVDK